MNPLPKKISPCPIVEAIVEMRFDPVFPPDASDALFGILYNKMKDRFSEVRKLPILQIPDEIREKDPNFQFKPYYQIIGASYILQVGPRVISLNTKGDYQGWENFSSEAVCVFSEINKLGVLGNIKRFALRYVNFFDGDIMDRFDVDIKIGNIPINQKSLLRTEIQSEKFISTLQITNDASMPDGKKGTVVDIDTIIKSYSNVEAFANNNLKTTMDEIHLEEKNHFFRIIGKNFLKELNPEY